MPIERINPDGMYKPNKNLYTQVVTSTGSKTIHIAGTVPFDKDGNVYGIDAVSYTHLTLPTTPYV